MRAILCTGDCTLGLPCQSCGSNGQYIGEVLFKEEYIGNWTTNYERVNVCGECTHFGPDGCKTSSIEAKYGSRSTPACSEFIGTKI